MSFLSAFASQVRINRLISILMFERLATANQAYCQNAVQSWVDGYWASAEALQQTTQGAHWLTYYCDSIRRQWLFLETLKQRGNNFIEHAQKGMPPLLHFDYEIIVDGRELEHAVNYALVELRSPEGVSTDPQKRPYIIIDPRAGHGPGIGGFKDDSQAGVALREGYPVYFVIFFPKPEPQQTLIDVCNAEIKFVEEVRRRHPDSDKPVVIGNCQGGWASMMLAASSPDNTGPLVLNGAPLSFWGGAYNPDQVTNPMRFTSGYLGGTWLSSLVADLGGGVFDGAWLVSNFESLNPSNTFWKKYYNLYYQIDDEKERFLDFERWWGGFFLMNRDEIEWITQNLFVGNQLWQMDEEIHGEHLFNLKEIRSPIIIFASKGDNITPSQQAFNWVCDIYHSSEEIKSLGQVIIYLEHEDIGHLGIFVSGRVARKEYSQIVSVLESIEALNPGLYRMSIHADIYNGQKNYRIELQETALRANAERLNRFARVDENCFKVIRDISEVNQRAYEKYFQPFLSLLGMWGNNDFYRGLHPLRLQRTVFSNKNPILMGVERVSQYLNKVIPSVNQENALRKCEKAMSDTWTNQLDGIRDYRDAMIEATCFQVFSNIYSFAYEAFDQKATRAHRVYKGELKTALIEDALSRANEGGYAAAVSRIALLLYRADMPVLGDGLKIKKSFMNAYTHLIPALSMEERNKIRGLQNIIIKHDKEKAIQTLPNLLKNIEDRDKLMSFINLLQEYSDAYQVTTLEQLNTLEKIKKRLSSLYQQSSIA
ncbi:MAG: DUF3141 domain-containing protein [Pseudomonadota bacterium]